MKIQTPSYHRHRFPSEIISHAVWLYHRFCLSFREVEELLALVDDFRTFKMEGASLNLNEFIAA